MKNKKKGFSVIEVVLVLGVIGILTTFLVPKTKNYLAMAKDTKAINILNGIRTASETYYLENGSELFTTADSSITQDNLDNIKKYVKNSLELETGKLMIEIGGSKTSPKDEEIKYGGKIEVYIDSNKEPVFKIESSSGIGDYSITGEKWTDL